MNNGGAFALRIGSEEDRCAEDPLESPHEPPILRSALLHAEGVQHLSRAAESNHPVLLLNRKGREEDRYQPVLTPRQSVCRVAGDLKQKLAVATLMQELPRPRLLHWQPAEDEWTGSEPEILVGFLPLQTNAGYRLGATKPLF